MSKDIQPKIEEADVVKTEQQLMQEFVNKYSALCEEYQLQIVVVPAWKISQDTGTWSTVLQSSIGKLPKKE